MKRLYLIVLCLFSIVQYSFGQIVSEKTKDQAFSAPNTALSANIWWEDPSTIAQDGPQVSLQLSEDGSLILSDIYEDYIVMTHGTWARVKDDKQKISMTFNCGETTAKIRDAVVNQLSERKKYNLNEAMQNVKSRNVQLGKQADEYTLERLDDKYLVLSRDNKIFCFCTKEQFRERRQEIQHNEANVKSSIEKEKKQFKDALNQFNSNTDILARVSVKSAGKYRICNSFDKIQKNIAGVTIDGNTVTAGDVLEFPSSGLHYVLIRTKKLDKLPEGIFYNLNGSTLAGITSVTLLGIAIPSCITKMEKFNTAGCSRCNVMYFFASPPKITSSTFSYSKHKDQIVGNGCKSCYLLVPKGEVGYKQDDWSKNLLDGTNWSAAYFDLDELKNLNIERETVDDYVADKHKDDIKQLYTEIRSTFYTRAVPETKKQPAKKSTPKSSSKKKRR